MFERKTDKIYTQYLGLSHSKRIQNTKYGKKSANVFRIFQTHRVNKTKLLKELKKIIIILEKEKKCDGE